MTIWSSVVNQTGTDEPLLTASVFNGIVEKGRATKGSFVEDYKSVCNEFSITPCPFITASSFKPTEGLEVCRIANAKVDVSNWRAMLIACATQGSKVVQIDIHFCEISVVHLKDLAKAIETVGSILLLRLHYLQNIDVSSSEFMEAIKLLFSDALLLEYLSLVGNDLGDDFLTNYVIPVIPNNYRLRALNLSKNSLTDGPVGNLFMALRHRSNIVNISLQDNKLTGSFLVSSVGPIIGGSLVATSEDDGT